MQLDPKQLTAFQSCIECGNLTLAAQSLNLTVAAVSLRITALEDALGKRLLIRGKNTRATLAGKALLTHVQKASSLENEFLSSFDPLSKKPQALRIAVNADSLASWFLPSVLAILKKRQILIQTVVDDQDHTHEWLGNGEVIGCVSALTEPLNGCVAEPLGKMRYRCLSSPSLAQSIKRDKRSASIHDLLAHPAVCFNRKDDLQDEFIRQHFGLQQTNYSKHYFPAVDAYHFALLHGIGWGMQADIQYPSDLKKQVLMDLFPGKTVDVPLYWHHWKKQGQDAQLLTDAIKSSAVKLLKLTATKLLVR
jgi:LysR family transcriptional regulator, chromosome initiation inhibitor